MIKRMMGAARLDAAIYEEVESDPSATKQALTVVILVALATGWHVWDRRPSGACGRYRSRDRSLGTLGVDHLFRRHNHIKDR